MKNVLGFHPNENIFDILVGENCLLDTSLLKIEIYEQEYVKVVGLELKMRAKSDFDIIRLEFSGVEEYCFYSSGDYGNCVESLKFFKIKSGLYYISLDPFDESVEINEQDQYFIISTSVKLEVLKS